MSGQTSKMVAHDKAEPSRLKQELKRCKNELVKNLQLEESRTSTKNKDTIHNKEPDTESSDPESDKTSEYMDDEDGGEYYDAPYTECAICFTPFIQYGEMYCEEGCPKEALDKLDNNIQPVITTDSDEPDYKNSINKETSTNIQPIASETAVKTKPRNVTLDIEENTAADITKTVVLRKHLIVQKLQKIEQLLGMIKLPLEILLE